MTKGLYPTKALLALVQREPIVLTIGLEVKKMTGQQMPVAKFRAGQISSAVWQNEIQVKGKAVTVLKATVQRRYMDKNNTWQSSGSFGRNEIPLAIHGLQQAFEKIIETQQEESDNGNTSSNNIEEVVI